MPIMIACLAMRSDGSWHDDVDDDRCVCNIADVHTEQYTYIMHIVHNDAVMPSNNTGLLSAKT